MPPLCIRRHRWRRLAGALGVVCLLLVTTQGWAARQEIGFDAPPAQVGSPVDGAYCGTEIPAPPQVWRCRSRPGVAFVTDGSPLFVSIAGAEVRLERCRALVVEASALASSPPNGLAAECASAASAIHARFDRGYSTASVSVGSAEAREVQLIGLNRGGTVVAEGPTTALPAGGRTTLSVAAARPMITAVVLRTVSGGSDVTGPVIDDLVLTEPGVPADGMVTHQDIAGRRHDVRITVNWLDGRPRWLMVMARAGECREVGTRRFLGRARLGAFISPDTLIGGHIGEDGSIAYRARGGFDISIRGRLSADGRVITGVARNRYTLGGPNRECDTGSLRFTAVRVARFTPFTEPPPDPAGFVPTRPTEPVAPRPLPVTVAGAAVPNRFLAAVAGTRIVVGASVRAVRTSPGGWVTFSLVPAAAGSGRPVVLGRRRVSALTRGRAVRLDHVVRIPAATPYGAYRLRACLHRAPRQAAGGARCATGRLPSTVFARPRPARVAARRDVGRAASVTIGGRGGRVVATAADGTRFLLSVPPGALDGDVPVRLTPLRPLTRIPALASDFGGSGVMVEPRGLRFRHAAELWVTPRRIMPRSLLAPLAFTSGGTDLALIPGRATGGRIHVSVGGAGGYAVGRASRTARTALTVERPPEDLLSQALSRRALDAASPGVDLDTADPVEVIGHLQATIIAEGLGIATAMVGVEPPEGLLVALSSADRLLEWNDRVEALAAAHPRVAAIIRELARRVRVVFAWSATEMGGTGRIRCEERQDFLSAGLALRLAERLRALGFVRLTGERTSVDAQGRVRTVPHELGAAVIEDLIRTCLRFSLEVSVELTVDAGDTVETRASAKVPVELAAVSPPVFAGEAPIQVDAYSVTKSSSACFEHPRSLPTGVEPVRLIEIQLAGLIAAGAALPATAPVREITSVTLNAGRMEDQVEHTATSLVGCTEPTYVSVMNVYDFGVSRLLPDDRLAAANGVGVPAMPSTVARVTGWRRSGTASGRDAVWVRSYSASTDARVAGRVHLRLIHTPVHPFGPG